MRFGEEGAEVGGTAGGVRRKGSGRAAGEAGSGRRGGSGRETGARGLASTLTRHLEDAAFGVFGVSEGAGTTVRVRIVDDDLAVHVG